MLDKAQVKRMIDDLETEERELRLIAGSLVTQQDIIKSSIELNANRLRLVQSLQEDLARYHDNEGKEETPY